MSDNKEAVNAPIFPKPPIVLLLFIGAGLALNRWFPIIEPTPEVSRETVVMGALIASCGIVITVLAAREMSKSRTTIFPGAPADALVTSGVFSRSRNPMYLGMVFFMLGLGVALVNPWLILLAPLLVAYFTARVIRKEEAYLERRFGSEYLAYRSKARRWF